MTYWKWILDRVYWKVNIILQNDSWVKILYQKEHIKQHNKNDASSTEDGGTNSSLGGVLALERAFICGLELPW